jgi:hypothetical protein
MMPPTPKKPMPPHRPPHHGVEEQKPPQEPKKPVPPHRPPHHGHGPLN